MDEESVCNSESVCNLLKEGIQLHGFSKDQKRSFRRKARGNYKVDNGALYLRQLKRVIKWKEEQEKIMIACHASPEGKSSGLVRIRNHPCDRPNTSGEGEGG